MGLRISAFSMDASLYHLHSIKAVNLYFADRRICLLQLLTPGF
jgi:hypothetical protein